MAQENCKHEGQEGAYCGLCGKQLEADPEVAGALARTLKKVLKDEYGMEPKPKPAAAGGDPPSSTLADKIFGPKKKREK